jgi:ankyrin repeat protein
LNENIIDDIENNTSNIDSNDSNNIINDDKIDDNIDNTERNNETKLVVEDFVENTDRKKGILNMHQSSTLKEFEEMLWSNKLSNRDIIIIAMNHSNNRLLEMAIYAKSISVNTTIDVRNNTCLHLAAMYGDRNKIEFLLQAGANIRAINNRGITPLHLAIQVIPPRNEVPFFEPYLPINIVKLLVSKGADVNYQDDRGTTPLHRAVLLG